MRHISECLPAELMDRLNEIGAGSGAATKALRPGPHNRRDEAAVVSEKGGEQPCEGGVALSRSPTRGEGAPAIGMKDGGANPTSLPPLWMVRTKDHGRVRMHGRARTAADGLPHPNARPYLVTLNGVRVDQRNPPSAPSPAKSSMTQRAVTPMASASREVM